MALPSQPPPDLNAPARLRRPDRQQLIEPRSWDDLVPQDHPVRALWDLVQRWDSTLFLQAISARGERPGRSATDPQLLIALWLYATIEGIGRGREWPGSASRATPTSGFAVGSRSMITPSTISGSTTRRPSTTS